MLTGKSGLTAVVALATRRAWAWRFCLHASNAERVDDLVRSTIRLWSSTGRNSHRTCIERSSLRSAALMPVSAGGGDERLVSVDPYYSGGAAPPELQG
ncbi:uncharacterized protein SCHCODRAFT_02609471 [Schizophyllum commune H4-8]|uniref:uncharacterized protein n=1 Tax=Schizophyllum commune (strain H4-8 / FGSC 9210) TaxID=578458 RepID=UPI00215E8867|nr:uncharacterized protein SCHCODRAFT_02609471 [Schizophyllum commune H4-8]KAI5897491.1 hypothetical protein SCHCODRAFT_02609471 [Schizophyllum commune H4-8]